MWHLTSGRGLDNSAHLLEHLAVIEPNRESTDELTFARIAQKLANCSTLIFVCCEWNKNQQDLVARLRRAGVATLALQVTDSPVSATDRIELHVSTAQTQLLELSSSLLQRPA